MRNVRTSVERWPLAAPFRISRGIKTVAEVVTVELSEGAASGRGECVPYLRYGETAESVLEQINVVKGALATGATWAGLADLLRPGAARSAIDCALWDLEAASSGKSVEETLGRPLLPMLTALTVSLDAPAKMAAASAALNGAELIKVKVVPL